MINTVEPKQVVKIREVYFCTKCKQVVVRYRWAAAGLKPYVKWCCGEKMVLVNGKCDVCGMKIRGANHFQGEHHLVKAKMQGG